MNQGILQSIETRRESLYSAFNLPPEAKSKAEELFSRMEEFGKTCEDQADFEKKLLNSPLTDEYHKLFEGFTRYAKGREQLPTSEELIKGAVSSSIEHRAKVGLRARIFRMMPESIQNWMVRGAYNIPIIGDILSARNQVDMVRRFTGRFNDDEEDDTKPEGKKQNYKKRNK